MVSIDCGGKTWNLSLFRQCTIFGLQIISKLISTLEYFISIFLSSINDSFSSSSCTSSCSSDSSSNSNSKSTHLLYIGMYNPAQLSSFSNPTNMLHPFLWPHPLKCSFIFRETINLEIHLCILYLMLMIPLSLSSSANRFLKMYYNTNGWSKFHKSFTAGTSCQ